MGLTPDQRESIAHGLFFFFGTILLVPRFYVRVWCNGPLWRLSTWRLSEVFVLYAWVSGLYSTVEIMYWNINGWTGSDEYIEFVQVFEWVYSLVYQPGLYACKAALLLYYMELSPRQVNRRLWIAFMVSWVLLVWGAFMHIFYKFFNCLPLYKNWRKEYGFGRPCRIAHNFYPATFSAHLITDIIIFILPFFILAKLKNIPRRQRIGASVMFGLGFLNIISLSLLCWQTLYTQYHGTSNLQMFSAGGYMLALQYFTALAVVGIPYVRRTWHDLMEWKNRDTAPRPPRLFKSGVFSTVIGRSQTGTTVTANKDATLAQERDSVNKEYDSEIGIAAIDTHTSRSSR